MNRVLSQDDLLMLRCLVQKAGWKEFMSHVGSLLAEQADKVRPESKQDKALFSASSFIHGTDELWSDCGFFDYSNHSMTPDEWKPMLSKYRRDDY